MARKTLLTEAEIRSFMKLANLTPVGDARLQEWSPTLDEEEVSLDEEEEEEEEMELDDAAPDADPAPADDMELDMGAELDPEPVGDLDMDMGDALDAGGDKEDQFMDLVQQLANLIGVDVEMDDGEDMADAEMDMDADVDMGDDVDSPLGGDELGDEPALDDDEMDDEGEEKPGMRYMEGERNTYDVVNEVAKRVSARLQQESKKQELVNELAERIFNRLASK